jgi:putative transposase
MPRQLKRYQDHGNHHLVTFSCYRRQPYLENDRSRTVFEEQLERLRVRHGFYVFGYVLMPEHVHMLVSEPKRYKLSTTLNVLKAEVSKQCKDGRKQFWQRRYHDFNLLTHRKHVEKLRYMHRNPVKRGLVNEPQDWQWSSFRHYLLGVEGRVEIESEWTWNRRERRSQSEGPGQILDSTHAGHPRSHP